MNQEQTPKQPNPVDETKREKKSASCDANAADPLTAFVRAADRALWQLHSGKQQKEENDQ